MRTLYTEKCECGEKYGLAVGVFDWLFNPKRATEALCGMKAEFLEHQLECIKQRCLKDAGVL